MVRTGQLPAMKCMVWLGNTVGLVEKGGINNLNHQFFHMLIGEDEARLMFFVKMEWIKTTYCVHGRKSL